MEARAVSGTAGAITERRIAWLTLALGFAASFVVALVRQPVWAAGLGVGTVLAWLNFRWLRRGLDGLATAAAAQAGAEKPQVPLSTYALILLRYGLIALAVYVIFEFLKVPFLSMVLGLCALGAATIAASVYEVLRPVE